MLCTVRNWTVRITCSFTFSKDLNGIIQGVSDAEMTTEGRVAISFCMQQRRRSLYGEQYRVRKQELSL
jgi:hypothetical protein